MSQYFLFVTANENEKEAFLKVFVKEDERYIKAKPYYIGQFGNYDAAYIHIDKQGMEGMPLLGDLVGELMPVAVVMVGVAFGVNESASETDGQKIGDVLVSDAILPYDAQKCSDRGTTYKEYPKEAGYQLLNAFKDPRDWRYPVLDKQSKVFVGAILTGSTLIDSCAYRKKLLSAFKKYNPIGGEMEANGIYGCCRNHSISEWIIVKGICDWGYNKQHSNKDQDQKTAAAAAVAFCHHVFQRDAVFDKLVKNAEPSERTKEKSDRFQELADLVEKSNSLINKLKKSILDTRWRCQDCQGKDKYVYLFPTLPKNKEKEISITTSSMVLCALHRIGSPEAQVVCEAIFKERIQSSIDSDSGAWKDSKGHCSVMDAAWAIYACLDVRCTLVSKLHDSIMWLVNAQNEDGTYDETEVNKSGGWGEIKNNKNSTVFHTAFAINALIEAQRAYEKVGHDKEKTQPICDTIMQSLKKGISYLHKNCQQMIVRGTQVKIWNGTDTLPCIASTSMAIHVLVKYYKLQRKIRPERETTAVINDLQGTVYHILCKFIEGGPPDNTVKIPDITNKNGEEKNISFAHYSVFPQRGLDNRYNYFTPILVTTLFSAANVENNTPIVTNDFIKKRKNAIAETIKWVTSSSHQLENGDEVFIKSENKEISVEIGFSAQSIILLSNWKEYFVKEMLSDSSSNGKGE
ncbi:hypothetical protein FACS18942_09460 [Planctomycetales bacterium]|nr:hypothetical protein FACS18942_09460 [Planctomycetales bacterium]